MKYTYLGNKRPFVHWFIFFFVVVFALSACKKKNVYEDQQEADVSFITFIQSLPQYTSLDFYLGGYKTTYALQYTQNSGDYLQSPPYIGYYSSRYLVQVGIGGTSTGIFQVAQDLVADKTYSFFVGTTSASSDTVSAVILEDNLAAPSAGKAKIRFVNMIRGAGSYDFGVQSAANLFAGKLYKSYTDFVEVDPGVYVYELKDAGTSTVKASRSLTVASGKIYTVWASGGLGASGSSVPLNLQVIVNK